MLTSIHLCINAIGFVFLLLLCTIFLSFLLLVLTLMLLFLPIIIICWNNVMTMTMTMIIIMMLLMMMMMAGFKLHHLSLFQMLFVYAGARACVLVRIHFVPNDIGRVGENGPWDQVPQINTKSNITSYQVTNLIPFTVYSFRLRAVNKLGISPPSKESYYIVSLREGKKTIKIIIYNSHLFTLAVCVCMCVCDVYCIYYFII